jgi:carboxypeptidase PM20D1
MPATVLVTLLILLVAIAVLVLVRTARFTRHEPAAPLLDNPVDVDPDAVARHLSELIQVPIVSRHAGDPPDLQLFARLHALLESFYPLVHKNLKREIIGGSLLYTWHGTNPDLEPVLLTAHQDVVPVDPETADRWQVDAFAGEIRDSYVWGRGALDDKSSLVTILEAVEVLLQRGFIPARTIYLGFGQDEEVGGFQGGKIIAETLKQRNIRLEAVLDEGGAIVDGVVPGVDGKVALIGTSEKGYLTLKLHTDTPSGHSATPSGDLAIYRIARALVRLVETPLRPHLASPAAMYLDIGKKAPFTTRMVFANLWLFGALARRRLSATGPGNATMRTTTAPTVLRAGEKDNILPGFAEAAVNFRLFPGDTIASVREHVRRVIDDPKVTFETMPGATEPSPVSPDDCFAFNRLAVAVHRVFPNVVVAPYLVQAMSDARHYAIICQQVYRFSPYIVDKDALATIHGYNERLSVDNLADMVQFYARVAELWGAYEWALPEAPVSSRKPLP